MGKSGKSEGWARWRCFFAVLSLWMLAGMPLLASPVHPRLLFGSEDVPALRARLGVEPYASMAAQIRRNILSVDYPQRGGNMAFIYLLTEDEAYARMSGLRALDYISNLDRWENDNNFGLRRGIDITAVMLMYDFCYHSPYWRDTIVPATVTPETFVVDGVNVLVPGSGAGKDATGIWHTSYTGRTITVPSKYVGMTLRDAISLALKNNGDSNIRSGGSGWPGNDKTGNNWWAVRYGSALLAYLVSDEPGLIGSANFNTAIARLKTHLSANLSDSPLGMGWNPEGVSYAQYPGWATYPAAIALKRMTGRDLVAEHPAMRYALWSTYMGALPWERKSRLGHPISGTGLGVKPDFDDDHNIWEGEGTAALAFAFAFNNDPADAIPDFDYRPGLKYLFNRITGSKGDRLWDSSSGNGLFAYIYYPPDSGPGAIAEQNPDSVWGRVFTDPSYGAFMFRSGHQDADFSYGATGQPGFRTPSTDIVTQTTINLRSAFGGHDGPDAQSLRLYGLGIGWAIGSGRAWIIPAQTSLMPYDPTTMGTGTLGVVRFGNEVVDSFLRKNTGDGYVITRQSTSDTGCTNHTRRLVVDYSGQSGAPALVMTYDTAEDSTAWWRLNTFINNTVDTSTPGQFVITSPEGHRLLGKILYPPTAQTRTGTIHRGNEFYFAGTQTIQNRWVDFPLLADGHALVALALVPAGQPLPTIQATGSPGGGFTVTAGGASFQLQAQSNTISSPQWNPPSVSITSPSEGAAFFPAPASAAFSGTASDNGTVARLDFYVDDVLRHTLTPNAPSVNWGPVTLNGLASGDRTIKVTATDNSGDTRTATRVVRVTNSQPPAISLTSPAISSQLFGGQTVTIAGRATDAENQLSRVEVWVKNSGGTDAKLGNATLNSSEGTWTYPWSNVPVGVHPIWAVAFDSSGDVTRSATTEIKASLLFSPVPTWGDAANYTSPVTFDTDNRWTVLPEGGDLRLRIREQKNYDYSGHLSFLRNSNNRNYPNFRLTYRVKVGVPLAQNPNFFTAFGTGDTGPVVFDATRTNSVEPPNSWTTANQGTRVWHFGNSGYRPELAYGPGLHLKTDAGYPNNPGTAFAGIPHEGWYRLTFERVGSRLRVWRDNEDGSGPLLILDGTHNFIGTRGPVGLGNERAAGVPVFFDDIDFTLLDANGAPLDNTPAAVTFSNPANFANLAAGAPITVTGTVTDAQGVAALELFAGATSLGVPTYDSGAGTWSIAWTPAHGQYALTLRVTDNQGFATDSPVCFVRVTSSGGGGGNGAPVVGIAHDTNTTGAFRVFGSVSDPDGSIAAVQVLVNGNLTGTATLAGSGWSQTLANLPEGTHTVVARAFDNLGTSTDSAPLNITITAPAVGLGAIAAQATVGLATTLRSTATDADGLLGVRYFANGVDLGAATLINGEWTLSWTPKFYGDYTLTAVATDRYGIVSTSTAQVVSVVPDAGANGSILAYVGGAGVQSLFDVHELSDGTLLLAGAASDLAWSTAPKTQLAVPGDLPFSNTGQTAFLLHLSADAQTVLGIYHLPAGQVNNLRWIKGTAKLGEPTGALYVSGKSTNANDGNYFIARLNNNFVAGAPTALTWVRNAKLSSTYGDNLGLQTWDVGGDGRIVFGDETGALRVFVADANNQLLKLQNLRGSHFAVAPYTDANRIAALGSAPEAAAATVSAVSFPGDLRSWTEEERLAILPDGNGSIKRGTWPYDLFFPVQDKAGGTSGTIEYGYTGYKATGKLRLGGIAVDRDTNDFYLGFNVQSAFWDAPVNKQQPDFEPAVLALTATGQQKWWSRLYHEVVDANGNGAIDAGETRLSSPDQYVDGLALDHSVPGDLRLVVNARAHGNNTSNLWGGNQIAAHPGGNGFQNAFTGTEGNIHLSWIGKLRAADGTLLRSSWLSGFFRNTVLTQGLYPEPIHDGWPSHNQGWSNLTTTRAEPGSLRVDAQGRVYIVGAGPRMVTTFNAHQKLPKITSTINEGIAPWNAFLRVYDADLSTLVYSSALTGVWTYPSPGAEPTGTNNTELRAVFPTSGGALTVGNHLATAGVANGNPLPVAKVPAWGRSTPENQTAFFGRMSFTTSANIPPTATLSQPTGSVSLRPGNSLDLVAAASDADGTIASVAFYANGQLVHTALAAPYAFPWTPSGAEGTIYTVQALATDDKGAATASAAATVRMELAPTVVLTAPSSGASVQVNQAVVLSATASDEAPGFVTKVEFFVDNAKVGEDVVAPFTFAWTPPTTGARTLQARATDNSGVVGVSSIVTVQVTNANVPPSVSLLNPLAGSSHSEALPLLLEASATDTGAIVAVEFFQGSTSLGVGARISGTDRYTLSWNPPTRGAFSFSAQARDDQGATTTTPIHAITVVADTIPAAPSELVANALSWRRAQLLWTDASSNEAGFQIERRVAGSGEFALLATVGPNVTEFIDTSGAPSTSYDYRIRAINLKGNSTYSATASLTLPPQQLVYYYWRTAPVSSVWDVVTANWNTAANGAGSNLAWVSDDNSVADLNNASGTLTVAQPMLLHRIQNARGTVNASGSGSLELGLGGLHLAATTTINLPVTLLASQTWSNSATSSDQNLVAAGPFIGGRNVILTWQPGNGRGSITGSGPDSWKNFLGRVRLIGNTSVSVSTKVENTGMTGGGVWELVNIGAQLSLRGTYTLAGVAGDGRLTPSLESRTLVLEVPASGDETFSGPVQAASGFGLSLVKNGPGAQTFSGEITHAETPGAVTVNSGLLRINGTRTATATSGKVVVNATGTLGGGGTVQGVIEVASSGRLSPGNASAAIGNLTLPGTVTLGSGAILEIDLHPDAAGQKADQILLGSSATLELPAGGTVVVRPSSLGRLPTAEEQFRIVSFEGGVLRNFETCTWGIDRSALSGSFGGEILLKPDGIWLSGMRQTAAGVEVLAIEGTPTVPEADPSIGTDLYLRLTEAPVANVTVAFIPDSQVSVSPGSLVFTPANWSIPQRITVYAVQDGVTEGASTLGRHAGLISMEASSTDTSYEGLAIAPLAITVIDDEFNTPPAVRLLIPGRSDIYFPSVGMRAVLQVEGTDQGVTNAPWLTYSWQQVAGPDGGVVFLDATARSTVAEFLLEGNYVLRATVQDGGSAASTEVVAYVGAGNIPAGGPTDALGLWLRMDSYNSYGGSPVTGQAEGSTPDSSGNGLQAEIIKGNGNPRIAAGEGRTGAPSDGAFAIGDISYGNDGVLRVSDHDALDGVNALSLSLWWNPTTLMSSSALFRRDNAYGLFTGTSTATAGKLTFSLAGNTGGDDNTFKTTFTAGKWHHIVVVYDGSQPQDQRIRGYVNGQLDFVGPETAATLGNLSTALILGRHLSNRLNARLDDFRLYRRALSAIEVGQLFAGVNRAPVVSAGADTSATTTASLSLAGSVTDADSTPVLDWTLVSGPGLVHFAQPASANSAVSFSVPGSYTLRLTATDPVGGAVVADDVTVSVTGALQPILSLSAANGTIASDPAQTVFSNTTTTVTLTATPAPGYAFSHWSGDVSGSENPAQVLMDANRSVTAHFSPLQYTLAVTAENGTVLVSPLRATYGPGTVVTLTPYPAQGYYFDGWEGDLSGSVSPASLTMQSSRAITARFLPYRTVSVTSPFGNILRSPSKLQYRQDETVSITAQPLPGYRFAGWSGDLESAEATLALTMDRDWDLQAEYLTDWQVWVVERFGTGAGEEMIAPLADPDGDGVANLLEFAFGTEPSSSASRPDLRIELGSSSLHLLFTPSRIAGLRYYVESSSNLTDWPDRYEITDMLAPGEPTLYIDDALLSQHQRRFLRLRVKAD